MAISENVMREEASGLAGKSLRRPSLRPGTGRGKRDRRGRRDSVATLPSSALVHPCTRSGRELASLLSSSLPPSPRRPSLSPCGRPARPGPRRHLPPPERARAVWAARAQLDTLFRQSDLTRNLRPYPLNTLLSPSVRILSPLLVLRFASPTILTCRTGAWTSSAQFP